MARRKKTPKTRNPEAKKLESPLFRQRIVPKPVKSKNQPPEIKEWE